MKIENKYTNDIMSEYKNNFIDYQQYIEACIYEVKTPIATSKLLIDNKGNIVPRNEIIRNLWEMEESVEDNTLTVNVDRIRRKLEDIGLENYLITRRGQGYMAISYFYIKI
ncbi:winged helix-turn-helix domain-containing protein [Paraclostridium sordellii]|uniref:winged helix-turn-helix domain-containing protein n=1 Tax=Paraclostridium sordellii TaxID=1505 RepID=UPI0022DF0CCD|nr:winged helix-turn-helix domain-containing protein [Paeniclostridium sordellii]